MTYCHWLELKLEAMNVSVNGTGGGMKRKRDPIFRPSEKKLLLDLVQSSFQVIENKKIDGTNNRLKTVEWEKISHNFNAETIHQPRSAKVLKNAWENLKKKAKASTGFDKRHHSAIDGEVETREVDDPIIERVLSIIGNGAMVTNNSYEEDSHSAAMRLSAATEIGNEEAIESEDVDNLNGSSPHSDTIEEKFDPLRLEIEPAQIQTTHPITILDFDASPQIQSSQSPILLASSTPRNTNSRIGRSMNVMPSSAERLAENRLNSLITTSEQAFEEHQAKMRIMRLQEQQEEVKLLQEKTKLLQEKERLRHEEIKTKTLLIELGKK